MTQQEQNSTPQSTSVPAAPVTTFAAKGASKEEFCINVVAELIRVGAVSVTMSKGGKDGKSSKPYGKFSLGDVPTRFGTLMELSPEQAKRIGTAHGFPLALDFSFALLDLTPAANVPARIAERRIQTATRQTNSAARMSEDVLLAELERRGLKGK